MHKLMEKHPDVFKPLTSFNIRSIYSVFRYDASVYEVDSDWPKKGFDIPSWLYKSEQVYGRTFLKG